MSTVKADLTTPGARPIGVTSPASAADNIRRMFDTIAPTYDRANHLLSFGLDRTWWFRAARALRPILRRPEAVVLDLCCGTGDMTLALYRNRPKWKPGSGAPSLMASSSRVGSKPSDLPAPILAADFSYNMLSLALPKFAGKNIVPIEADALRLPLADSSVDLVTFAFGFRNLSSYPAGLNELHRVLRPNGEIAILECNQPEGFVGSLYNLYFQRILPTVGGWISRDRAAYDYLPHSVSRFPRPAKMKQLILEAGFIDPTWTSYTFSTAGLYRARRP
jgi:demethylmenaquinone methyltransferase/2-methoxy-6-polyprenyl-1,4-benzoquinol methylase